MLARKYTKETILNVDVVDRNFPEFRVGDCLEVSLRIKEGEKERLQVFEGDVIAQHNHGISSTFTIRRIGANGVSVERILPVHSPIIASIKHIHTGDVRRAKLYYMRDRIGKNARVKEKVLTKEQKDVQRATKLARETAALEAKQQS